MISVKTIFKVLIGTISIIVVFAFIVEFLNVHTSGQQVVALSKIGVRQACVLYAQETYKSRQDWDSGATTIENIVVPGTTRVYATGDFYDIGTVAGDPQAVSNAIYLRLHTTPEFRTWVSTHGLNWESIRLMGKAINNNYSGLSADDKKLAESYREVLMTPLNTGVPYMDRETLEKMVRWNLAELFSNGDPDLIIPGDATNGGEDYILFKGFKIYANQATVTITNDSYRVFDLTQDADAKDFFEITHIEPRKLGYLNYDNKTELAQDERSKVCILGVTYNVPISYEGVTFVKSMVAAVANNDVKGFNGLDPNADSVTTGRDTSHEYFDTNAKTNLTNKQAYEGVNDGFGAYTTGRQNKFAYSQQYQNGNPAQVGSMAVPGKLLYYMVR